jgi:8-oxo-dGTP pyrophosphatase MutT (NUDIX family)
VSGGLLSGMTPLQNMFKEAAEEAGFKQSDIENYTT